MLLCFVIVLSVDHALFHTLIGIIMNIMSSVGLLSVIMLAIIVMMPVILHVLH